MTFPIVLADPQLALLWGLGVGAGLWLIVDGLRRHETPAETSGGGTHDHGSRLGRALKRRRPGQDADAGTRWRDDLPLRLLAAGGVAVLVGLYTRWPVAAILSGAAMWALPGLLGSDAGTSVRVARVEAIASWTEMLRDTLSAAAGLEQAITATAPAAPAAIREHVQRLAQRLSSGQRLPDALRAFGEDLNDPTADLVIAALLLASQHQARQVGDLLSSLAATAREQVTMRQRVDAGRARTRTSVRVIVGVTLVMAAGLVLLNRPYLAPYDSPFGQLVLTGVGAIFTVSLWWLSRIAVVREPARVLTGLHALTVRPSALLPGQPGQPGQPGNGIRTEQVPGEADLKSERGQGWQPW